MNEPPEGGRGHERRRGLLSGCRPVEEEGFEVIGVHMELWQHRSRPDDATCCSITGQDDARAVCQILGIPFHTLDFSSQFQKLVVDCFCREYAQGRTPNPCVVCNRFIKFDLLLKAVEDLGAECLATGHYAGSRPPLEIIVC